MPRYVPTKLPPDDAPAFSQETDAAFEHEVEAERKLLDSRDGVQGALVKRRLAVRDVDPYGARSPHSWILDSAARASSLPAPLAEERLNRFRAAHEKRAVSSTTLGGLIPSTVSPWLAEAVAYGLRSTAPLALALERLDLPPVGTNVSWAKVTTAVTTTAGSQSAENAAVTASTDPAVASATDALKTIATYVDFSAQSSERSGGWFDLVIGEELGRAFGSRLEQQVWNGSGASGQITGFLVMPGSSSSTVAGQTLAFQTAKLWQQYDAVATNLGSAPDLVAMASRRAGGLGSLAAAIGLPLENLIPSVPRENIIVSPGAPLNLGAGTNEDWIIVLNKASTPLVRDPEPTVEIQQQGAGGTGINFKMIIYAYVALGVSRRPEGVGLVRGLLAPAY